MTVHALDRLRGRFGLDQADWQTLRSIERQIEHRAGTEIVLTRPGFEWHRLTVEGRVMIALWSTTTRRVVTLLKEEQCERRPKPAGRRLSSTGKHGRSRPRAMRALQDEEDLT